VEKIEVGGAISISTKHQKPATELASCISGQEHAMQLHPEWRQILRRAWSLRLIAAAVVLSSAEVVLPLYTDAMPRGLFAMLSILVTAGAFVARLLAQPEPK
jgi:hypothetical protein